MDNVGQIGAGSMHLRKRLAMLKGIYADEMPFSDPHTVARALWALRISIGSLFEISNVPLRD